VEKTKRNFQMTNEENQAQTCQRRGPQRDKPRADKKGLRESKTGVGEEKIKRKKHSRPIVPNPRKVPHRRRSAEVKTLKDSKKNPSGLSRRTSGLQTEEAVERGVRSLCEAAGREGKHGKTQVELQHSFGRHTKERGSY